MSDPLAGPLGLQSVSDSSSVRPFLDLVSDAFTDNAVFTTATRHMGANIGKAITEAGLPATSIDQFLTDILTGNVTGLFSIPGATPAIIAAGADARLDTFVTGFRNVWVSALCFIVLAAIGKAILLFCAQKLTYAKLPCSCSIPAASSTTESMHRLRRRKTCTLCRDILSQATSEHHYGTLIKSHLAKHVLESAVG